MSTVEKLGRLMIFLAVVIFIFLLVGVLADYIEVRSSVPFIVFVLGIVLAGIGGVLRR